MKELLLRGGTVCCLMLTAMIGLAQAQPAAQPPAKKNGVLLNESGAFKGYTMIAPMQGHKTYLIDMDGHVVKTWDSDCKPAMFPYLQDNGNLLRPGQLGGFGGFAAPGAGGRVQEFDWDGKVLWDFKYDGGKDRYPHHDICRLPNGNVLMIVSEKKSTADLVKAGRRPETAKNGLSIDCIVEIKPSGKNGGDIVWEWHTFDHLVQDLDKEKDNFAVKIADRPQRVDINFGKGLFGKNVTKKEDLDKLKGIGYLGGPGGKGGFSFQTDWTHFNAVDYNADLDQIMISVHNFSEVWIIDHSTTTKEAAGSTGGKSGMGGDLLYRWGNPRAYRAGINTDQRLFDQHNAHWIPKGLPGAGNVLVFNNGNSRLDGNYSSVDEFVLPLTKDNKYERKEGQPFGPSKAEWSYVAPKKSDLFSFFISGAQRLPNGNTLICAGASGTIMEVTRDKELVWKFVNPRAAGDGKFAKEPPPEEKKKDFDKKKGKGGFGFDFGFGSSNQLFRAVRISADHPALKGRDLKAGAKLGD